MLPIVASLCGIAIGSSLSKLHLSWALSFTLLALKSPYHCNSILWWIWWMMQGHACINACSYVILVNSRSPPICISWRCMLQHIWWARMSKGTLHRLAWGEHPHYPRLYQFRWLVVNLPVWKALLALVFSSHFGIDNHLWLTMVNHQSSHDRPRWCLCQAAEQLRLGPGTARWPLLTTTLHRCRSASWPPLA